MPDHTEETIRRLSKDLRALQAILRLKILSALGQQGAARVSELGEQLRVSQPLLSWHLGELRRVGFVDAERVGREVFYQLRRETLRPLILELADLLALDLCRDENQTPTEESKHE